MKKERIQKLIASAGICSRRKAEEYIISGAVKVNGREAALGDSALASDVITVNGERVCSEKKQYTYIKFYKPRGIACTLSDPHEKRTLSDFLKEINARVYPVGRLDKNSEGLLILTDDGQLAQKLTHPKYRSSKRYRVTVRGKATDMQLAEMSSGVMIESNGKPYKTAPCAIEEILHERSTDGKERTVLEFVLREGKNRQIRKMCESVKLEIIRLKRVQEGGVKLGMLKPGKCIALTKDELKSLSYD